MAETWDLAILMDLTLTKLKQLSLWNHYYYCYYCWVIFMPGRYRCHYFSCGVMWVLWFIRLDIYGIDKLCFTMNDPFQQGIDKKQTFNKRVFNRLCASMQMNPPSLREGVWFLPATVRSIKRWGLWSSLQRLREFWPYYKVRTTTYITRI